MEHGLINPERARVPMEKINPKRARVHGKGKNYHKKG